jgi:DNA-binding NarL/FixJ family response regulator
MSTIAAPSVYRSMSGLRVTQGGTSHPTGRSYDEGMMGPRHLLIVEDEPMVASLLGDTLAPVNFEVCIAHSAAEAIELTRDFDPDVAILDINLGRGANGIDLAFILSRQHPGIAILLLTQHPDLRTAGFEHEDLPAGCGFLRKDAVRSRDDLITAIDAVIGGGESGVRQDSDPARPLGDLTITQVEVLRMVAQGYTNQEIARRRGTSTRAVEQVLNAVFMTLGIDLGEGINPRVEAVRRFITAAGTPDRI